MRESNLLEDLLNAQPEHPLFPTAQRETAAAAARMLGLPGRKVEGWRYTPLRRLEQTLSTDSQVSGSGQSCGELLEDVPALGAQRLVFFNGAFSEEASRLDESVPGLRISSIRRRADSSTEAGLEPLPWCNSGDTFVCINTAVSADGALIEVTEGVQVAEPIHLIYVAGAGRAAMHLSNHIKLESGASLKLIEHYISAEEHTGLMNCVTQVALAPRSQLNQTRIQASGNTSTVLAHQNVSVADAGRFEFYSHDAGGALSRTDLRVALEAPESSCKLSGLYLVSGQQLIDNHITVEHCQRDTSSEMTFKGVLDAQATGVFNGRVMVHKGADGTDAQQSNGNLVLSRDAQINTKPELEIYADDVKCAHGTTVGQLDETALFYLRSRGIPRRVARNLLTYAFCTELLEQFEPGELHDFLIAALVRNLPEPEAIGDIS